MTIAITGAFDSWVRGFAQMAAAPGEVWADDWSSAVESLYDSSQEHVHVDTGFLKASGHWSSEVHGGEIVGEVAYDADYAVYEHDRGGEHAFLLLAYLDAEDGFGGVLGAGWDKVWED